MEIICPTAQDIKDSIRKQLAFIGENPGREGLLETPERVIKSWEKLYGGYKQNPEDIMKTFKEEDFDELVLLKNMEFFSTCEHHMLPFFGSMSIGYIPNGKILGVSKLARIAEIYCRRLQIQERLVSQIADGIEKYLNPLGVMVVAEAQHFCMTARGVEKQHSKMVTSAVRGVFKTNINPREEMLKLIGGQNEK